MLARLKNKPLKKGSSSTSVVSATNSSESEVSVDVQAGVYTRWINDKLKGTPHRVNRLFKDLENGLVLIALLELLSGKKVTGK